MAQHFKDYYKILDIPFSASEPEIKSAYRKMARLFHPDMHPEDAGSYTAKFQEITEAYETLSDEYKKEIYDLQYRSYILNEDVYQEEYYRGYYEEPQQHTAYRAYYKPAEKRRTSYVSYGSFVMLVYFFMRLVMNAGCTSAPTYDHVIYDNKVLVSPKIKHLIDSLNLNVEKDSLNITPKPF